MNILFFITSIILSPLVFSIYIVKPIIHFRFGIIPIDRFAALLIYYNYLIEKKESIKNNNSFYLFDIIGLSRIASNRTIKKILKKNNNFYNSFLIRLIIEALNFYLGKNNIHTLYINNTLATSKLYPNVQKKINTDFLFQDIEKYCHKFDLKINSKWICIHNRDAEYLKNIDNKKNFDYHNYRDFKIKSYAKLIHYFLDKNYHVFRIGKISNEKLLIKHSKLFDLPNYYEQNDIFDLFLLLNCRLFIGCDSGPWTIPYLNNKFILKTNYTTIGILQKMKHNNFLFIFKRFKDKKNNKLLSIKEIFKRKLENVTNSSVFEKENIELIPNDEITIYEAGIELEKIEKNIIQVTNEEQNLQKRFWDLINQFSNYNNPYPTKARVSKYFLKNNEDLLN